MLQLKMDNQLQRIKLRAKLQQDEMYKLAAKERLSQLLGDPPAPAQITQSKFKIGDCVRHHFIPASEHNRKLKKR